MAKYIDRDGLVQWLKAIRMVDLSDGKRLAVVIFKEDFEKAIKTMPESLIIDVGECNDCVYRERHQKCSCCRRNRSLKDCYKKKE